MSRPLLDLRRLRYFRAVAGERSLSAAARKLNLSQPALTHHMQAMEASLALKLIERSPRGIELTPAGTFLLARAEAILDNVAQAEEELRALAQRSPRRPLRLAILSSLAPIITPAVIEAAAARLPDTFLQVQDGHTRRCREEVAAGRLDIALVLGDRKGGRGVPLQWEPLFLVSRPGEHAAGAAPVRFSELKRERLVVPARPTPLRELLEELAMENGVELQIVADVNGVDARKRVVMAGLGSTLLPFYCVAEECKTGLLVARPFADPQMTRLLVLEHRADLDPGIVATISDILAPMLDSVLGLRSSAG